MKKKRLTINDIARDLNVSKSTVSRAFRDTHDINPATKAKILKYAARYDFHPSQTAQNFKAGSTKTIGVIVPAYNIPFYSIAICGIQDYAMENNYNVMVCHSSEHYETEVKNIGTLLNASVDGIIISVARDTEKNEHIRKLHRKGLPMVMFNRVVEDLKASKVVVDDYYGAYNLTQYLIDRGNKRIAHFMGPSNLLLSKNRLAGFLDAMKKNGLAVNEDLIIEGNFTIGSGEKAAQKLLKGKTLPDAIFCVCDAVAYGVMKILKKAGLKIPEDISVAGFTNEPMCEYIEPTLTTVNQPIYEIGQKAAELLFAQFNDENLPAELCVLETKIVVRESTK